MTERRPAERSTRGQTCSNASFFPWPSNFTRLTANVIAAISDNMLADLGMNTNDFNYGQTIFLVSFLSAELPSGLVSKKLGPDV